MNQKLITRKPLSALLMAALCGFASAGCKDLGLRDNIPLGEAEARPPRYMTYQMSDPARPDEGVINIGDRQWVFVGQSERIPERLLVAAGDTAGTPVFALATDAAPHDRLYVRDKNGSWRVLAQLH